MRISIIREAGKGAFLVTVDGEKVASAKTMKEAVKARDKAAGKAGR